MSKLDTTKKDPAKKAPSKPAKDSSRFESRRQEGIAWSRRRARNVHPLILLTEEECKRVTTMIGRSGEEEAYFPGKHRPEGMDLNRWKAMKFTELQDDYPATGFGTKEFEELDWNIAFTKIKEQMDEENWPEDVRQAYLMDLKSIIDE